MPKYWNSSETWAKKIYYEKNLFDTLTTIRKIYFPTIAVVGLVGNLLFVGVFLKSRSIRYYFRFLGVSISIADNFVVILNAFQYWYKTTYNIDIRHRFPISCIGHSFAFYFALDLSTWLLIGMHLLHFLVIRFPIWGRGEETPRRSAVMAASLAVTLLILVKNAILLFWNRYEYKKDKCVGRSRDLDPVTFNVVNLMFSHLLPGIALTTITLATLLVLCNKTTERIAPGEATISNSSNGFTVARFHFKIAIATSFYLLATSLPYTCYFLVRNLDESTKSYYGAVVSMEFRYVAVGVFLTNFAFKYYIAVLINPHHRKVSKELICCRSSYIGT